MYELWGQLILDISFYLTQLISDWGGSLNFNFIHFHIWTIWAISSDMSLTIDKVAITKESKNFHAQQLSTTKRLLSYLAIWWHILATDVGCIIFHFMWVKLLHATNWFSCNNNNSWPKVFSVFYHLINSVGSRPKSRNYRGVCDLAYFFICV